MQKEKTLEIDTEIEFYPFSGNNLCPLENPFPCPSNFLSCVAQDDANVIDTVPAESYEYCGGK